MDLYHLKLVTEQLHKAHTAISQALIYASIAIRDAGHDGCIIADLERIQKNIQKEHNLIGMLMSDTDIVKGE